MAHVRLASQNEVYESMDKRRVLYNKQKETIKNWRMVKELEEPDHEADSEKPGRGTIERFVPPTSTKPVRKLAPNPHQVASHRPLPEVEYLCQGDLVWREEHGCVICNNNIPVTYKNVAFLYQFVSNSGRVLGPQTTGLCQTSYQVVTDCISTARDLGLMAHDYKPLEYQSVPVYKDKTGVKDAGH